MSTKFKPNVVAKKCGVITSLSLSLWLCQKREKRMDRVHTLTGLPVKTNRLFI